VSLIPVITLKQLNPSYTKTPINEYTTKYVDINNIPSGRFIADDHITYMIKNIIVNTMTKHIGKIPPFAASVIHVSIDRLLSVDDPNKNDKL